jgi:MerR-like DNA binding protein
MIPDPRDEAAAPAADKFDDEDYPAYTMGRAAEILGATQGFLRSLDEANLIQPQRSAGGHRRYSRFHLRLAARVRELVDQGTPVGRRLPHRHPGRPTPRSQHRNIELDHQD